VINYSHSCEILNRTGERSSLKKNTREKKVAIDSQLTCEVTLCNIKL